MLPTPTRECQACSGFQLPEMVCIRRGGLLSLQTPNLSPSVLVWGRGKVFRDLLPVLAEHLHSASSHHLPWTRPAFCTPPAQPVGIFFPHFYLSESWHQQGPRSFLPISATLRPNASPLSLGRKLPGLGAELPGGAAWERGHLCLSVHPLCQPAGDLPSELEHPEVS